MFPISLFSSFDPGAGLWFSNWSVAVLITLFVPLNFWVPQQQTLAFMSMASKALSKELFLHMGNNKDLGSSILIVTMFYMLVLLNLIGLTPYLFTVTSHLTFTLALALPTWVMGVMISSLKDTSMLLAHLVPSNTPVPLIPLMVIIELTSMVIRPLTLSVRLMANMVAGHLLLTLISGPLTSVTQSFLLVGMSALIMMMVLELMVASIQAYVFTTLSGLYMSENLSSKSV